MCDTICGFHMKLLRYSDSKRSIFCQRKKYCQRLKPFLPIRRAIFAQYT